MADQALALLLADALEGRAERAWTRAEVAAELRRLHAENALLHERHRFDNGVLKELLEALRWIATVNAMDYEYQAEARAAIAKAEEAA